MPAPRARRDAILKTLPLDRQAEVVRILDETGITPASLARLKEIGIEVRGIATLSRFRAWYDDPMNRAQREMEAAGSVTAYILNQAARDGGPSVDQETLFARGQQMFAELAIGMRDPKAWLMTQQVHRDRERVALKREELDLAERRFQRETCELFLKWYEDKRAAEIVTSGASQADKIQRLGAVIFGDLWETSAPAKDE